MEDGDANGGIGPNVNVPEPIFRYCALLGDDMSCIMNTETCCQSDSILS